MEEDLIKNFYLTEYIKSTTNDSDEESLKKSIRFVKMIKKIEKSEKKKYRINI